ncbi:hypothetical protein N0V90_004287 [Kalmusia sp. IMI 367209]|nr:hypothetical protein N0V90_004287 [Kalmusia sp. IMI 367209]
MATTPTKRKERTASFSVRPSKVLIIDLAGQNSTKSKCLRKPLTVDIAKGQKSNPQEIKPRYTFLDLPSEIRNQIYELTIVTFEIRITSVATTAPQPYGNLGELPALFKDYWEAPDLNTVKNRCTWVINPIDLFRKFVIDATWNLLLGPYGVKRSSTCGGFHPFEASYVKLGSTPVTPNLFLVNKQVYQEASTLFFVRNHFIFDASWTHTSFAPLAFLYDHSGAYAWLRSLHIRMDTVPNWIKAPELRAPSEYAFPSGGTWKDLIAEIGKMRLRHFGLSVNVDIIDRLYFNSEWRSVPKPAPWLEGLKKIRDLQSMAVDVRLYTFWLHWRDEISQDSDIPVIVSMCDDLKEHWLSSRASNQQTFLDLYEGEDEGFRQHRLSFRACVEDVPRWQLPRQMLSSPEWKQMADLTERYRQKDYVISGI